MTRNKKRRSSSSPRRRTKKKQQKIHRGRVLKNARGFAFVVLDSNSPEISEDIFLDASEAESLYSNDIVEVEVVNRPNSRSYGTLIRVVERGLNQAVGEYKMGPYGPTVEISGKGLDLSALVIPTKETATITPGSAVLVALHYDDSSTNEPMAEILKVVGSTLDYSTDDLYIISKHKLTKEFPESVLAQANSIPSSVTPAEIDGRKDFRDLPFITIDGITAKDFDDAVVAIKNKNGSITLRIAIADVAHYVDRDSPLDLEALARGNSTYFPHSVIPMLPERLSNGICSLNPKQDRLTMVCEIQVMPNGSVRAERFFNGVIFSHRRCTYEEIQSFFEDETKLPVEPAVAENIRCLHEVFLRLHQSRVKRGTIDLDIAETRVIVDQSGKPKEICKAERLDSHRVIEECMIAANEAVARFIQDAKQGSLYRVHEYPDEDAIEKFREISTSLGVPLQEDAREIHAQYQNYVATINESEAKIPLSFMLLRSMKQAIYSPENLGHFALASEAYSHFTSPIRRYPDLVVHRILKHLLKHAHKNKNVPPCYSDEELDEIAKQCSTRERASMDAEREMVRLKQVRLASEHLGEEFQGLIIGCNARGMFIELDEIYLEGFLEISRVDENFQYDERTMCFYQPNSGRTIRIGNRVLVQIVKTSPHLLRVDLEPIEVPLGIKLTKNPRSLPSTSGSSTREVRREREAPIGKSDERGPNAFLKRVERKKKPHGHSSKSENERNRSKKRGRKSSSGKNKRSRNKKSR